MHKRSKKDDSLFYKLFKGSLIKRRNRPRIAVCVSRNNWGCIIQSKWPSRRGIRDLKTFYGPYWQGG